MNSVSIIGRLTRDPELRYTGSGTAVCSFTVAVDRAGDKDEGTGEYAAGFFDVTVWGASGEATAQYLEKGQRVGVNGRLFYHKWEAQDGTKRNKIEIVAGAFGVDWLDKSGQSGGDGQTRLNEPAGVRRGASGSEDVPVSTDYAAPVDDDIPF